MNTRDTCRFPLLGKAACCLVIALLAAVLASPAAAGGLDDARKRGKLLVGVKTDFPPFGYLDQSGRPQGFDIEIARYLATALFGDERKIELVPVTSNARIPALRNGSVDLLVATLTVTDDRRKEVELSEQYFLSESILLVLRDSPIKGLEDVTGKSVAIIAGSVQEKDLAELAPQAKRVRFERIPEAIQALKNKQVDAFCQDAAGISALTPVNQELQIVGNLFSMSSYAIAVRKGDIEFVRWINGQLARMKSDGSYERFVRQFFHEGEARSVMP
jgi:ABC-type amino acid transport substrate-binding protein